MSKEPKNIFYLSGSYFQREKDLMKIKALLGSFELSIFNKEYNYDYVEQSILENSLFSANRLYIIDEWPTSKMARPTLISHFKKMLAQVTPDCTVVLNNLDFQGDGLSKYVSDLPNGVSMRYAQMIDRQVAAGAMRKLLDEKEKNISDDLISMAIESVVSNNIINLDSVFTLVFKLCDYAGNRKKITEADVMDICLQSNDFIIWDLTNKLDQRNLTGCISLINKLIKNGDVENAVEGIFQTLLRRYTGLLFLKDELVRGKGDQPSIDSISKIIKLSRTGKDSRMVMSIPKDKETGLEKISPAFSSKEAYVMIKGVDGNRGSVGCYSLNELSAILELVGMAQGRVRESGSLTDGVIFLELLCAAICGDYATDRVKSCFRYVKMDILESVL